MMHELAKGIYNERVALLNRLNAAKDARYQRVTDYFWIRMHPDTLRELRTIPLDDIFRNGLDSNPPRIFNFRIVLDSNMAGWKLEEVRDV